MTNTTVVTESTPGVEICGGPSCKVGYFIPNKRTSWSATYCSRKCAEQDAADWAATERDKYDMRY